MTRRAQPLDGFPSLKQLVEKARTSKSPLAKRALQDLEAMGQSSLSTHFPTSGRALLTLAEQGAPISVTDGRVFAAPISVAKLSDGRVFVTVHRGLDDETEEAYGFRLGSGGVHLMLPVTPRTKKNSTVVGMRQGPAYRWYRDCLHATLRPIVAALELPLAIAEYNLAATFYVDKRGERADLVGLLQGLCDAIQRNRKHDFAGVVSDDWQFRTSDGTRIIAGDARPRVGITITPLTTREA